MSQKLYDVIAFSVTLIIYNKSMLQILHLNTLYLLALVSMEKDVNCVKELLGDKHSWEFRTYRWQLQGIQRVGGGGGWGVGLIFWGSR